jgi:hypothetical protein
MQLLVRVLTANVKTEFFLKHILRRDVYIHVQRLYCVIDREAD